MTQPEQKQAMIPVNQDNIKAVIFSLLILVSGIIIGAGGTLIVVSKAGFQPPTPPLPEEVSHRFLHRLLRELNLRPEQREQLDPIIKTHMQKLDEIRREARPKVREEIENLNQSILAVLDEPQKELYQSRIRQMQEHWKRRQQGGPGWHQRPRKPGSGPRGMRPPRPPQDQAMPPGDPHETPPAHSDELPPPPIE